MDEKLDIDERNIWQTMRFSAISWWNIETLSQWHVANDKIINLTKINGVRTPALSVESTKCVSTTVDRIIFVCFFVGQHQFFNNEISISSLVEQEMALHW